MRVSAAGRKKARPREAEVAIARIAAGQQGMITTAQLLSAGFGYGAISQRAATGWLVRRHSGVYQLGVFGGPFGTEMAALLACGDGAVLGHRSATVVCGYGEPLDGAPVDVITRRRSRPGIRAHHVTLRDDEVMVRHGLRITTPVADAPRPRLLDARR